MTIVNQVCTCDQHGDYCEEHPTCACGCQRHAHRGGACIAGKMNCHGCDGYRPARFKRFEELCDGDLEHATGDALRLAYKELRAHHVEETTALWTKIPGGAAIKRHVKACPFGWHNGELKWHRATTEQDVIDWIQELEKLIGIDQEFTAVKTRLPRPL